ncbi:MAG: hypothetical protein ABWZ80_10150 [Beijerinckiaceae bacterium]
MRTGLVLAAIAAAVLGGCQSTVATLTPPRPEAAVVFTSRGAPVRAKHFRQVAPDCSSLGYADVAIITPPRNGAVELRREGAHPSFASSHPRFSCNARLVDGVGVYYRPNPGFAGSDRFTIQVIWTNGDPSSEDFIVQVR